MDVKYSGALAVRRPGSQQIMTISRRRAKPFLSANLEESKQMEKKYRHPEEDTMDINVDDNGDKKQTPSEKDGDEVDALTDIKGGIQSARKRKAPTDEAPQRKQRRRTQKADKSGDDKKDFEVEELHDARFFRRRWEYLVKYKNCDGFYWTAEKDMNCLELVAAFLEKREKEFRQ
uniref:Chromo domain-containing protein n=1 Tax=Chromera velia CCMP2878 TaxID=1169474 RepID=A0A0G4HLB2_9ALVE|eukprot:Cvel_1135.t1-p1 / transcript=Cvel_1135.t1 / gene=Cvel_1135 / organism=Chromera_velia_CCMP2878 / gene_product=hypothetical protein / transcript_product=hypothetical protein / location=Cvel_scaffold37:115975-116496(+) / protein_length=174 / sequence_SO=supercontig / SO=protein_coding / is_pseudo=false